MTPSPLILVTENIQKLRPEERVVGAYLYDKKDELLSRVKGVLVEQVTWQPRYLVFNEGGFLKIEGKTILVPRPVYEVVDVGRVKIHWTRESMQSAPTPNNLEALTREEEELILNYYDHSPYWFIPEEGGLN